MTGFRLILKEAEANRIHFREILGDGREGRLVAIRARVAHRLRQHGYSTTRIGRVLHRDHTSTVHLLQTRTPEGDLRFGRGSVIRNEHKGIRI